MKFRLASAILGVALVAGCDSGTPAKQMVTVSGIVIDPDIFGALRSMGKTGTEALMGSVISGKTVSPDTDPTIKSAPSGADGSFSIKVPANTTIHLIVNGDATYEPTITQDEVQVGTVDLSGVPAHGCGKAMSTVALVAAAAGMTTDAIAAQGVCMFGTIGNETPPDFSFVSSKISVSPSTAKIYAVNPDMSTGMLSAAEGDTALTGLYGITQSGLTAATDITITPTDTGTMAPHPLTYAPFKCTLHPGMVTFSGEPANK